LSGLCSDFHYRFCQFRLLWAGPLWALLEFAMLAACLQIGYMTGLLAGVTLSKYLRNPANHRVRLRNSGGTPPATFLNTLSRNRAYQ